MSSFHTLQDEVEPLLDLFDRQQAYLKSLRDQHAASYRQHDPVAENCRLRVFGIIWDGRHCDVCAGTPPRCMRCRTEFPCESYRTLDELIIDE